MDANWDDLDTRVDAKQAELVSGTNIKTVNGQSLLGSGDLAIGGGGGGVTVSISAPGSPTEGDLWYNPNTLEFLVYASSAWYKIAVAELYVPPPTSGPRIVATSRATNTDASAMTATITGITAGDEVFAVVASHLNSLPVPSGWTEVAVRDTVGGVAMYTWRTTSVGASVTIDPGACYTICLVAVRDGTVGDVSTQAMAAATDFAYSSHVAAAGRALMLGLDRTDAVHTITPSLDQRYRDGYASVPSYFSCVVALIDSSGAVNTGWARTASTYDARIMVIKLGA